MGYSMKATTISLLVERFFAMVIGLFSLTSYGYGTSCSSQQLTRQQMALNHFAKRNFPKMILLREEDESGAHAKKVKGELAFGPHEKWHIPFIYYQTKKAPDNAPAPLLLLYSGIGGITILDRYLAHYFTDHGYSVVLSHYFDEKDNATIQKVSENMLQGIYANFALVDYFSTLAEIDPHRIGSLGISFGGVRAVHHTVIDERVKASVLMVTGGPLPEIMTHSKLDIVEKLRTQQMKNAGLTTKAQYREALEKSLSFNLEDWTCRRSSNDFFMFISNDDDMVPTSSQWHLYEMLSGPAVHKSSLGHIKFPIWASIKHKKEMVQFFAERF